MFKFFKTLSLLALVISYQLCNVSAYTASADECGKSDGITASGTKATVNRTIASDFLSFGTLVIIDGKTYTVEDRFGGGYTDRIDIFMKTKKEAFAFGRQWKIVQIMQRVPDEEVTLDTLTSLKRGDV